MSKNYKKVLDIYNKLPKEQQLYVAPSGKFVDSPHLLDRYILERQKGFIEAYKTANPSEAFITLAVAPEFRGQGLGKKLINESLSRLKDKGIKNIIYKVDNANQSSKNLVEYFSQDIIDKGDNYTTYKIPIINNTNAYADKFYSPLIKDVLNKYKTHGIDLSDTQFELSYIPKYTNNKSAYNLRLPSGGSYIASTGKVQLHPNIYHVINTYGISDKNAEQFAKHLVAHELAHKIDYEYLNTSKRNSILNEAKLNKFTTKYLDMVDQRYKDKELLAEYLSYKLYNN